MMIGRTLAEYFPSHVHAQIGDELLRVEGLSSPRKFADVSFTLRNKMPKGKWGGFLELSADGFRSLKGLMDQANTYLEQALDDEEG